MKKHQKYIFSIVIVLSAAWLLAIPACANSYSQVGFKPTYYVDVEDFIDTLKSIKELIQNLWDLITSPLDTLFKKVLETMINALKEEVNAGLLLISDNLRSGSNNYFLNNYTIISAANSLMSLFKPLAATLAGIAWSAGVIKTMLHYDDKNPREILRWVAGLIFYGTFINSSFGICMWLVDEEASLVNAIMGNGNWYMAINDFSIQEFTFTVSEIPFFGWTMEFMLAVVECLPALITLVALLVVAIMVYIKLIIRQLEIICMVCVSPLFFGCLVSEVSRPWFKNFLSSFFGVVFETVFMAISLTIGVSFVNAQVGEATTIIQFTETVVLVLAVAVTCLKPSRVLTNLVKA